MSVDNDHESPRSPMLASDAEREQSILLLRDAVAEGRLTLEEFSERVALAQAARTDLELARLGSDLPRTRNEPLAATSANANANANAEQHRATFSHVTRTGPWSVPRHSWWRSIFGTIDLDLRQARLDDPDTLLEIQNVFSTVTVIVPDGVEVVVRGGGLFASQRIEAPERPPVAGGPRLTIDVRGPGGTLHVRSRPAQSLKTTLERALKG